MSDQSSVLRGPAQCFIRGRGGGGGGVGAGEGRDHMSGSTPLGKYPFT